MKLNQLKPGEKARIIKIVLPIEIRQWLMSLGFIEGDEIIFERFAPLKDPQEFIINGNCIALRKDISCHILVDKIQ